MSSEDFPSADYRRAGESDGRPRYAAADLPVLLWRERRLMAMVFLILFALGVLAAFAIKREYPAHSSVLVRLGPEYVYDPLAGDAGRGTAPATGQVLESETDILGSDALKAKVVREIGYRRLHPSSATAFAAASLERRRRMLGAAVAAIRRNLKIETAPDTPVIGLTYWDSDPARAALVLNTLLADYLVYRRTVLQDPTASALEEQRRSFQARLDGADSAYQAFLSANRIGDFEADKTAVAALQAQVEQQRYAAEVQLRDRLGHLAGLEGNLARVAPRIGLYRDLDNTAGAKLADLKVQREGLLARYRPDSAPVKALESQIVQLQSAVASERTQAPGAERVGVNPVYETLETEKFQTAAEVAALRQNVAALERQSGELTDRGLHLAALEPQFQQLSRERDVLQNNVRDFTAKEEQSRAAQEMSANTNDNIRIVERASVPTQGRSLRIPVLALSLLFAMFTAVCAGLLRMFVRPGLPTPASASRTLDLPVLGVAALKA
ncbi:MAG: GumC family protein [Caulobacteraceae bacterium]